MSLGERLREARKAKNMTQTDLARELGISVNSVANYERGTSFPKEDYLYKIINLLELDPNYLFQDNINGGFWFEERMLLENYRCLDKKRRFFIDYIVRHEAENEISDRLASGEASDFLCLDITDGLCGRLRNADDEEKMMKIQKSKNADYLVMIRGKGVEPVVYDGDFLSVRYAAEIGNMCWGLYNFDGFTYIAVKKEGNLYNLSGKMIDMENLTKKPVLYGRVIEIHKTSPLRSLI